MIIMIRNHNQAFDAPEGAEAYNCRSDERGAEVADLVHFPSSEVNPTGHCAAENPADCPLYKTASK